MKKVSLKCIKLDMLQQLSDNLNGHVQACIIQNKLKAFYGICLWVLLSTF